VVVYPLVEGGRRDEGERFEMSRCPSSDVVGSEWLEGSDSRGDSRQSKDEVGE